MSESPAEAPPETPNEPAPPADEPARRHLLPWLSGVGFLILVAAIVWVWLNPLNGPPAGAPEQIVAALEARVARLEQRPAAQPTDLSGLTGRVGALEQRPAAPEFAALSTRVAALEKRQVPDQAPLEARVAALEARQAAATQMAGRLDALSARADSLETAQRTAQSDLARRLDADDARIATIERNASQISALADRAAQTARMQAAQLALNAGQPLGELPGAPPALARFASAAPPTEAALKLAFAPAARAAVAAARPPDDGEPLLARIWARAQDLVTVRQGDRVLVGDPAAGVLGRARTALDAGDLAGAVAAVGTLTGPPAQAMAGWLADARSLLDARAALADRAAHS
jgi:hypothetical protein